MKILVYPHDLGVGGSQINAIDLAAAVSGLGHETVVFGRPGPLTDKIAAAGLEFVAAPAGRRRPSPAIVAALSELALQRNIDVLHGYEWPPILEAWLAARRSGAVAVGTVMSMAVAPFVPLRIPLLVGTEQIAAAEMAEGRTWVSTLEPPVDLATNDVAQTPGVAEFRQRWNVLDSEISIVAVCRLAHELKLEGLLTAIECIADLAKSRPVRLLIVGSGPAKEIVLQAAVAANRAAGRPVITLTGELADPRPAYVVGDIQLAMGSSAIRAMAFAKPVVVQGEQGFWKVLDQTSRDEFLWTGFYGVGPGPSLGRGELTAILSQLSDDPRRRQELGAFGRVLAEDRFSLDSAARRQLIAYQDAREHAEASDFCSDLPTTAWRYGRYALRRRLSRWLGTARRDDFNSRPVAAGGPTKPTAVVA